MKKFLSIMLTVLMIVTMIPFAPLTMAADTVTLYLKNDAGWQSTMYAYCWKENDSVRPLGNWPGTLMDKVEGESQLYAIDVPADTYAIIFNDGANQTEDLFLPTDGSNYYNNATGEWTTISTRGHDHALTAGGEALEFATLSADATEISTAGNYYLTQDIELTDNLWINVEGTVNLCLNGHSITAVEKGGNPVVVILKAGTLNLCDCQGGGCITSAEDLELSGVRTLADTEFNMYSGEIKNNYYYAVECIDFNMYGGKLSGNKQAAVDVKGAFNMYGGEISGNSGEWGTVSVGNNGSFTMYDGEIKDNINKSTYWNSGTVYVQNGIFTMKGGKITGNTGGSGTGGVHAYRNFVMDGGEISGNSGNSGGVSVGIDGVFTMNGGKISGNKSNLGGGVYINERASFNMNGGEISGNTAEQGGGVFSTYDSAKINLKKGVITGNSATYAGGVGAQYANTPVEISGADVQIINNTATTYPDLRVNAPVTVSAPLDSAKTKISLSVNGGIIAKPDGTNLTTLEGMEDCFIVSEEDGFIKCNEKGELELTEWNASISEKDGDFVVEAPHNGAYTITYQWYELNGDELTELEGETSDKLTADKIVIGKTYACKIYLDGEEKDLLTIKYPYRITHQPTAAEPYVELNDDTDATYRWYAVEGDKVEFTNENANPIDYYDGPTEYDPETGWNADFWSETGGYFFCVYLEEGEKITVEFNHPVYDEVGIWGYYENDGDYSYLNGETTVSLVAPFSDYFDIYAYGINADTRVKAYIENRIYTEIEGQTTATLTPTALGKYACEVTFADGTTEMSDTFEVTKLHDCDFSGEWKYDAEKHWKECTVDGCSETSEEAEHSFTDGKCSCGYACPHEWDEGVLTRPERVTTTDWDDGYYTYTCSLCGHYYHETVKRADYSVLDAILEDFIDAMYDTTLLDSIRNELEVIYFDNIKVLYGDYIESEQAEVDALVETMTQKLAEVEAGIADGSALKPDYTEGDTLINGIIEQFYDKGITYVDEIIAEFDTLYNEYLAIWHKPETTKPQVDEIVEELKALKEKIDKGTEDGTLVKADYTEIDEAIAEIEQKFADENVTDEAKAELEEIKTQLEEMKADTNTSKADLAKLEKALGEYGEELDKGIEDGALVKFSGERVFLELAEEAEKKIDEKYGEDAFYNFANANRDSFYNLYDKYFFRAAALEGGTMAENAENIEYIKKMVDELFGMAENCIDGTHNYGKGVLTRPTFETTGYYTYTCTLCGHSYTEPAEKADTTALNDASMKVTEYIDNDTLTQEARGEIYNSYRDILKNNRNIFDELGFVCGDLVEEDQPAIDAITAELEKIVADAEEKIASGEYVKAEYTEIDEAIDDIEEKLASENVTDEGKAELEEIKKQLEEMKADENTSAADVAELEKALEDYEEELDKGIEDGTLVEVDVDAITDDVNKKWAEKLEAEGLLDEYEDFINNQKATDEAMATVDEINDFANSLEGTVAENAENIAKLNEMLDSLLESWENCLRGTHNFKDYEITSPAKCEVNAKETSTCWFCGETDEREVEGTALTHSFTKYEETEAPKCGVAGKKTAYCDHGCGATDEKEIEALTHVFDKFVSNGDATCTADGTKTASCIHGCGTEETVTDEGTKLDHADEDGDSICDDCEAEIIDVCPDCGRPVHEDEGIPHYICIIIMFIRLVVSLVKALQGNA